jgi:sirohydrochlorin cobaltochelatase
LAAWLAAGENRIGELVVSGEYELRHWLDAEASNLTLYTTPQAARDIARYDAGGVYRPLRTAPNLRRGWRLTVPTIEELHDALDAFYPAMLAARLAFQQGRLAVTPLRDTLNRQSGMYAVTRRMTDAQGDALIGAFCRTEGGNPGCLKTILWPIAPGVPITSLPGEKVGRALVCDTHGKNQRNGLPGTPSAFPLLCAEACNLLVARAREAVKQQPSSPAP